MDRLPYSFALSKFGGMWRPLDWSGWKSKAYNIYTLFVIVLLYSYCLLDTINLLNSKDNFQEFTNEAITVLTVYCVYFKALTFLIKRRHLINLVDILQRNVCQPRDSEETAIQMLSDRRARTVTMFYASLVGSLGVGIVTTSFFEGLSERKIPIYRFWMTYPSLIRFLLGIVTLTVTHMLFSSNGIATDSLFAGMMIQTSTQLEILSHRLRKIPHIIDATRTADLLEQKELEKKLVVECVRHHCHIFELANTVQNFFTYTIFLQFTISTISVCFCVLTLSKLQVLSSDFVVTVIFLSVIMCQIFLFCWYGNTVILQSADVANAVYEMEWSSLSSSTKKILLMIMARSLHPIQFTSARIIVLSLDTYNSIMKLSYSAYNVLSEPADNS